MSSYLLVNYTSFDPKNKKTVDERKGKEKGKKETVHTTISEGRSITGDLLEKIVGYIDRKRHELSKT